MNIEVVRNRQVIRRIGKIVDSPNIKVFVGELSRPAGIHLLTETGEYDPTWACVVRAKDAADWIVTLGMTRKRMIITAVHKVAELAQDIETVYEAF